MWKGKEGRKYEKEVWREHIERMQRAAHRAIIKSNCLIEHE